MKIEKKEKTGSYSRIFLMLVLLFTALTCYGGKFRYRGDQLPPPPPVVPQFPPPPEFKIDVDLGNSSGGGFHYNGDQLPAPPPVTSQFPAPPEFNIDINLGNSSGDGFHYVENPPAVPPIDGPVRVRYERGPSRRVEDTRRCSWCYLASGYYKCPWSHVAINADSSHDCINCGESHSESGHMCQCRKCHGTGRVSNGYHTEHGELVVVVDEDYTLLPTTFYHLACLYNMQTNAKIYSDDGTPIKDNEQTCENAKSAFKKTDEHFSDNITMNMILPLGLLSAMITPIAILFRLFV